MPVASGSPSRIPTPAPFGEAPVAEPPDAEPLHDERAPRDPRDPRDRPDESDEATTDEATTGGATDPREETPPTGTRPRHRWIYNNLIGARYNPLGLIEDLTVGYRYQLVNRDDILFRESFIAPQLHAMITPAYAGLGARVAIQPAAVFNIGAAYDYVGFFGAFGSLQSFPEATADWSDSAVRELAARTDDQSNYSAGAHLVTLSSTLQGKVKRVAFRTNVNFYWGDFDLRPGDRLYQSQTLDMLLPNRGWGVTNDLDLLYLFDFGLIVGARHTVTHAFYRDRDFGESPVDRALNGPTHRVGPAFLYTFFDRPAQRFNRPTLILLVQWWARHRFRTGQDVSAAIPYLVLAFTFNGDLHPDPASWNPRSERRRRR